MSTRSVALCFHAVSEDWPAPLAIEPEQLRVQVEQFLRRGYEPVTFNRLVANNSRRRRVAVTFDDAFLSVYSLAFPILSALGVPATVFVPTAHIGANEEMAWPGIERWQGTRWSSELRGASWEQLRELAGAGWEIGSHTRTHPRLSRLDAVALSEELVEARRDCEREIGVPCRTIAYPYGDFDGQVVVAAAKAGYEGAAALAAPAPVSGSAASLLQIPRVGVYRGDGAGRIRAKALLLTRWPRIWNLLLAARDRAPT